MDARLPILQPIRQEQIAEAKRLIVTVARNIYRWSASVDEMLRHFAARGELSDMDDIQANYLDQGGLFLAVMHDGRLIGTGALRRLDADTAELKRLWLLEAYHGQGIGFRVMQELLTFARASGYARIVLQTDYEQTRAIRFYTRLGFMPIPPYREDAGDVYMALPLPGR